VTLGATVTDVGPVVVIAAFPGGRECRYVVSGSQRGSHGKAAESFACRELIRDLCRGFVPMCAAGGGTQSVSTVKETVKAIRHLARTVDERAGERAVAVRLRDLTTDDIKAFEDRLVGLNPGGRHAWCMSRNLSRLLVAIDEEWPGRVPPAVRQRTRFRTLPLPRPSPREPFSPFVAAQLRKVCIADMRAVVDRIRSGSALLATGMIPGARDWDEPANVLKAIDASKGTLTFMRIERPGRHRLPTPFGELVGLLYPTVKDLLPFLVMLALQSGLPIECCMSLRRDCLRNPAAGTVQIDYEKWRAGPSPFRSKRYPDGGLNTPGGVVRAVLEVTERAAQHCGQSWLFVAHRPGVLERARFHHLTREQFVDRHGLVDDDGSPLVLRLSRLRKTRMSEWAKEAKRDPEALARRGDHTLQVNWESYADVEAMRPIYEETIAAALAHAAAVARHRPPTILAADVARPDTSGLAPEAVATALQDGSQTWLAGCSGFEGSPFATSASGCSDPFWGCLECPNAVIHEAKLPAIVATLDRMVAARRTMSAEEWRARFGRPFLRIVDDVIPAFGPSAWDRARRQVAARSPLRALPSGVFDA
jgi:hypothetical protein